MKLWKSIVKDSNTLYNAISQDIKPSPSLDLIDFPDGFDVDMEYQLRERDLETLE